MITRHDIYGIPWIDLFNPSMQEIHQIIDEFSIDERCAVELVKPSLLTKVERFDNHLFFVLHFPDHPARKIGNSIEIDFVVHHDFIITTRYTDIDNLIVFEKKHTAQNRSVAGLSVHGGTIFGAMITDLYGGLFEELSFIKNDITQLENRMFETMRSGTSLELMTIHRKLLDCKSALRLHTDILHSFEHESLSLFGTSYGATIRDIMNIYYRMTGMLDSNKELVYELRESYDAFIANQTNSTMRTLTLMSFVTFPLSLIAIILFDPASPHIFHSTYGFWIVIGILFIIFLFMMLYFKKKKWL
jgi:magnesium transporter